MQKAPRIGSEGTLLSVDSAPKGSFVQETAIKVKDLKKRFGDFDAVKGVSLDVPRGSIFGILGPNGAGKTTTLRMILGIIDPDEGKRVVLGEENPANIARKLGYLPEERGLYPTMKAIDVIAYMGAIRGMKKSEAKAKGKEMLEAYGLSDAANKRIRQLSKGMAQTVQIIGTLVHSPELVVLDEPFSGLDAINQGRLEELIREIAQNGTTVIFSTHVIAHAERLCENIAIIAGGKIKFSGSVDEARDVIPPMVKLETQTNKGKWTSTLPDDVSHIETINGKHLWQFALPLRYQDSVEPFLKNIIDGKAGVVSLSIERAGLHDAFVKIAGAPIEQEEINS